LFTITAITAITVVVVVNECRACVRATQTQNSTNKSIFFNTSMILVIQVGGGVTDDLTSDHS